MVRGRTRILAAALQTFAAQGFDRTTTRDIGRAAGVTSPALYRHYATKDALGLDLYRRCYALMTSAVQARSGTVDAPLAKLLAYVEALTRLYGEDPLAVLFVDEHQQRFWPQLRHEFEPHTLSNLVGHWVEAGRSLGAIRQDVHGAAQVALVMGLVSQWCAMCQAGLATPSTADSLPAIVRCALSATSRGESTHA